MSEELKIMEGKNVDMPTWMKVWLQECGPATQKFVREYYQRKEEMKENSSRYLTKQRSQALKRYQQSKERIRERAKERYREKKAKFLRNREEFCPSLGHQEEIAHMERRDWVRKKLKVSALTS